MANKKDNNYDRFADFHFALISINILKFSQVNNYGRGGLTVCVTGRWAGVDSAWEQYKLEARKMLDAKRGDESPSSSARCVGRFNFLLRLL